MKQKLKVLVGDDQIGVSGSHSHRNFMDNYQRLEVDFDFTADPERFIELARDNQYDALMIDLKWCDEDVGREYKTGFRVLEATREYAPVRILHTSEDKKDREKGFQYGATHCLAKGMPPEYLENILRSETK